MDYIIQQIMNGLSVGSIYALTAIGYTMVYGILRLINFAHGDILMVGAYAGLVLGLNFFLPTWVALLISVIVACIFGYFIERFVYRPLRGASEAATLLSSLAISLLLEHLAMLIFTPQPKAFHLPISLTSPITVYGIITSNLFYLTVIVTIVLAIIVFAFVKYSKAGIAMRACSENIIAANLMGISVNNIVSITFLIGAGLASFGGFMLAGQYARIDPLMGFVIGVKAFISCVIGGIGNIYGAVLGGFILGLSEMLIVALLPAQYSGYRDAFVFSILIIILLIMPNGIFGSIGGNRFNE
jgi:branched-chain amino acid transport system permease protein